jgi:hypothetical protein
MMLETMSYAVENAMEIAPKVENEALSANYVAVTAT